MAIDIVPENIFSPEHSDTVPDLLGQMRRKIIAGAYDVLQNHHEDILVLSSGDHQYQHRLARDEAKRLEQAVWSAGEDRTLENLLSKIQAGLEEQGMHLNGHKLDITLQLKEVPAEQ